MRCPYCGAGETRVADSRLAQDGDCVRRRRQCTNCGERFTTYETAELSLPRVIKSDGRRESFEESKLRAGLTKALEKRPVATGDVDAAVRRLIRRCQAGGEREIPARCLGDWVMEELRQLDEVAYVRFASVYRSFQDVEAFKREVERLRGGLSGRSNAGG